MKNINWRKKMICSKCKEDISESDFGCGTQCKECVKKILEKREKPRKWKIGKGVCSHRAVIEIELGRKLLTVEHIHHCDGNRSNNNINNLFLTDRKEHGMITRINNLNKKNNNKYLTKKELIFIFDKK